MIWQGQYSSNFTYSQGIPALINQRSSQVTSNAVFFPTFSFRLALFIPTAQLSLISNRESIMAHMILLVITKLTFWTQ